MESALSSSSPIHGANERVTADITPEDVLQIAREAGLVISRKQAASFLHNDSHAHRMWKQMVEAGRQYIAESLEAEWVNDRFPAYQSPKSRAEEYDA
jgi:hypothetical protein